MGSLADFGDFILSTTQAYLRGPKVVIREAVENTYLFGDLMVGAGMRDILMGGAKITDSLTLHDPGLAQTYGSGDDTFTWQNPQTLQDWNVEWRFALTHFAWTDQERALQGTGEMTQRARFKKFKDVYDNKVGTAYQSLYNLLEALLWRVPNKAEQEVASGEKPYSIPAFINARANGLFVDGPGGDWTVVEGIDPTAANSTRWVPAQVTYNSLNPDFTAADTNLLQAFDDMQLSLTYKPFRGGRDYLERSMRAKKMILCSKLGYTKGTQIMRQSQDLFTTPSRQDADYSNPMYAGIPFVYCSAKDDLAIYNGDAATLASETDATEDGPRYEWADAEYLRPVFHRDRMIKQHTVKEHPNQPFTKIVPIDVWYNVVCRSRQRMGIVYPSANVLS